MSEHFGVAFGSGLLSRNQVFTSQATSSWRYQKLEMIPQAEENIVSSLSLFWCLGLGLLSERRIAQAFVFFRGINISSRMTGRTSLLLYVLRRMELGVNCGGFCNNHGVEGRHDWRWLGSRGTSES